jgi:hypothetical protein
MRHGITITPRGVAWTFLVVFLAGVGALAGYCAVSRSVSGPQGFGVLVLIVAATIDSLWLRRDKLHQPGRHRS